ncbi:MAG: 50S ribosomal protein L10 [Patescibacteria group bacterium]
MPKTRDQKKKDLDLITKKLDDSKSVVFANFFGLKVKDVEQFRKNCRKNDLSCLVAKKTILSRVLKDKGIESQGLEGEVIAVFGKDEVTPAKTAAEFAKDHEPLKIIAGILEGKFENADMVKALAKLPGKQELLAKMCGSLNAPISGFVNVLAGNMRNLVYVLNAIKGTKN